MAAINNSAPTRSSTSGGNTALAQDATQCTVRNELDRKQTGYFVLRENLLEALSNLFPAVANEELFCAQVSRRLRRTTFSSYEHFVDDARAAHQSEMDILDST